MTGPSRILAALKVAAWERAKGELRSMAALDVSGWEHAPGETETDCPAQLGLMIEAFITAVEDAELPFQAP